MRRNPNAWRNGQVLTPGNKFKTTGQQPGHHVSITPEMCTFGTSKHSDAGSQPGRKTKTPSTPANGPGTRLSSDYYMSKGQKNHENKNAEVPEKAAQCP